MNWHERIALFVWKYAIRVPFRYCLIAHARGGSQSGGDGGKYGDGDVQNLLPDSICFHVVSYKL